MNRVNVIELVDDKDYQLELMVVSGAEFTDRAITDSSIHKLGLALTGIRFSLNPGQVQIMGGSEIAYLQMLAPDERDSVIAKLAEFDFPCLIATRGMTPHPDLCRALGARRISCMRSSLDTAEFIRRADRFLDDHLAPRISFHGVLVDVIGMGVLILGQSGIGKSETALDLVLKGHRLVADDIVDIYRRGNASLVGKSSEMIQYHMEIRGLGIINIQDLYGISATRERKRIDLVVELVEWEEGKDYDRLGLDEETYPVLGLEIPHLTVPVRPGRNLSSIIEVAARNQLLKQRGHHSAREFQQRLLQGLTASGEECPVAADEVE
ncbi:MAG TPA: HPr(Ser) kinase/phosphatase [bacterium]|nr:HPr(Ser) kinase/phosphatase [bacterium]